MRIVPLGRIDIRTDQPSGGWPSHDLPIVTHQQLQRKSWESRRPINRSEPVIPTFRRLGFVRVSGQHSQPNSD